MFLHPARVLGAGTFVCIHVIGSETTTSWVTHFCCAAYEQWHSLSVYLLKLGAYANCVNTRTGTPLNILSFLLLSTPLRLP